MNKGIIVGSTILGGAYIVGNLIRAKAVSKSANDVKNSVVEVYDKLFDWCNGYMKRLGYGMNDDE